MTKQIQEPRQPGIAVSVANNASTPVVTANRSRAKLSVTNDSDAVIYLRLAAAGAASAAVCGVRLAAGDTWVESTYTGPVCAWQNSGTAKGLIYYEI